MSGMAFFVSFLKAKYYDGYFYQEDIFRYGFEWHIIPTSIAIIITIYVFMHDYFDYRIYEVETYMGYKKWQVFTSHIICEAGVLSIVLLLWMVIILILYYVFLGKNLYTNVCLKLISVFMIYFRICIDSVLLIYIINNFFIYCGALFLVWISLADKLKIHIGELYLYKLSYKYQMSIIDSFGGADKMLIKKVIPSHISFILS